MQRAKRFFVGGMERITRAFIGIMALAIAYTLPLTSEWFAGLHLAASYPLLTAMTAWDPVYSILGFLYDRYLEYKTLR